MKPTVNTWTGSSEISQPNNAFVFSDNIEDWIKGKRNSSYSADHAKRKYKKRKAKNDKAI